MKLKFKSNSLITLAELKEALALSIKKFAEIKRIGG